MKALGQLILHSDLRWKYEDNLKLTETMIGLCEGWKTYKFLDAYTNCFAREQNCVTITITAYWSCACIWYSYWALKESSMLFFHTKVQAVNARGSSFRVVQCVYCDWKDFDNLKRTMQCVNTQRFVKLDSAQNSTHLRLEMNMHYQWSHQQLYLYLLYWSCYW